MQSRSQEQNQELSNWKEKDKEWVAPSGLKNKGFHSGQSVGAHTHMYATEAASRVAVAQVIKSAVF